MTTKWNTYKYIYIYIYLDHIQRNKETKNETQ